MLVLTRGRLAPGAPVALSMAAADPATGVSMNYSLRGLEGEMENSTCTLVENRAAGHSRSNAKLICLVSQASSA